MRKSVYNKGTKLEN